MRSHNAEKGTHTAYFKVGVDLFVCWEPLQKSLEYEDLGPKRIEALEKEAEEWRRRAEAAVSSIQDITVSYFKKTSKALAGTVVCVWE